MKKMNNLKEKMEIEIIIIIIIVLIKKNLWKFKIWIIINRIIIMSFKEKTIIIIIIKSKIKEIKIRIKNIQGMMIINNAKTIIEMINLKEIMIRIRFFKRRETGMVAMLELINPKLNKNMKINKKLNKLNKAITNKIITNNYKIKRF